MNRIGRHAKARPGAWRRIAAALVCAAAHLSSACPVRAADDALLPELSYKLSSNVAATVESARAHLSWTPGSGLPLVKPPRVAADVWDSASQASLRLYSFPTRRDAAAYGTPPTPPSDPTNPSSLEKALSDRPAPGIPRLTLSGTAARPLALVFERAAFLGAPTRVPQSQTATAWTGPCLDNASAGRRQCAPPANRKKGLHHELWFVTIEVLVIESASIAAFAALPKEISGFAPPDIRNIARFTAMGPHFDSDRLAFNYVGHPLAGSEYYLVARNRKATFWQGMLYTAAFSTLWEYGVEQLYERASIQDLIVTPVSGAVLGELRYQLRRALINPATGRTDNDMLQFLVVALDPVQAVADAVPLKF